MQKRYSRHYLMRNKHAVYDGKLPPDNTRVATQLVKRLFLAIDI